MENVLTKRKGQILPAAALVIALLLPAVLNLNASNMSTLIMTLLYMYWASAWNIMGGYAGLFSLGNGIYIGLGAYITAILYCYFGVTPYIGMLVAGLLTGLFSVLIGYPTFRIKGVFYSLATCALLAVLKIVFTTQKELFGLYIGGADGFKIPVNDMPQNMQFASKLPYYYIILGLLICILIASSYIAKTRTGYYFRAINANADAAASLGVNVVGLKIRAQFISALFTAVGGGFYCILISYIDPSTVFGSDMSVNILIMCMVGGVNTLWGPVIGAGLLYTINRFAGMYFASRMAGMATVIFGATLMLVIYFIPQGLLGWMKGLVRKGMNGGKGGGRPRKAAAAKGGDGIG